MNHYGVTKSWQERLGSVGVWFSKIGLQPANKERELVQQIESLYYKSLWIGESDVNKEALTHAGLLLASSKTLIIGTGIANIWARDATAMNSANNTLNEAYDNRFLLGLGVSHIQQIQQRGHIYRQPLSEMKSYLEQMDSSKYISALPPKEPIRILAALGPKMLKLAAQKAHGAHTYFVNPNHTQFARQIIGSSALLIPEQAIVLESDPTEARTIARTHMSFYLKLPNYVNNLLRLGFKETDIQNGGSNKLVDSIVAWGNIDTVVKRIEDHLNAGADHVVIQPLSIDDDLGVSQLIKLSPAIKEFNLAKL